MQLYIKQLRRKPLFTVLMGLLLALAAGFSAIGYAAWDSAQTQLRHIGENYTTIGVIKPQDGEDASGMVDAFAVLETAKNAPGYLGADNRYILSAHVEGQKGLSSGTLDPLDYHELFDRYSYAMSVLAVRCEAVETSPAGDPLYTVSLRLEAAVCRMAAYDLPPEDDMIYLSANLYLPDGSIPFSVGKTYLIRGLYTDYPVISGLGDGDQRDVDGAYGGLRMFHFTDGILNPQPLPGIEAGGTIPGTPHMTTQFDQQDGKTYPIEGDWPFFAEYTGDYQDFLESQAGTVWREEIIPTYQLNHDSAPVMLTGNLESLYLWNTGAASLLSGRRFTAGEYASGTPVCIISAAYAQLNGLAVGDTLTLDFYDAGYYSANGSDGGVFHAKVGNSIVRKPMLPENRLGLTQTYEIVGIYTAPTFALGTHNFHGDTIFVPKASLPEGAQYQDLGTLQLNSILLENGMAEEFEAYMAGQGYGGVLLYGDQEFAETQEALETLLANALRLWLVGAAAFILTAALFLFLSFRRVAPTVRGMRLLGIPGKGVAVQLFAALALVIAGAVALGGGLAAALFGWVTRQTLSGQLALRPQAVLLAALVQLAALLPVTGLWAWGKARQNLMKKP